MHEWTFCDIHQFTHMFASVIRVGCLGPGLAPLLTHGGKLGKLFNLSASLAFHLQSGNDNPFLS